MQSAILAAALLVFGQTLVDTSPPTSVEPPELDAAPAKPLTLAEKLDVAIQKNDLEVIEGILREDPKLARANNRNHAPLIEAVRTRHKDAALLLISYGAEVDVFAAAGLGMSDRLNDLLDQDKSLLSKRGWAGTPLEMAVHTDQLAVAKLLIDRGAIALAKKETCQFWRSAPEFAATSVAMMELILRNGGDPNANPCGITLLAHAINSRQRDLVKAVLDCGADVNGEISTCVYNNMQGILGQKFFRCTPLHYAVWYADDSMVSLLLAHKAKIHAIDSRGQTPLDAAIERRKTEIATVLRLNGGKTTWELDAK